MIPCVQGLHLTLIRFSLDILGEYQSCRLVAFNLTSKKPVWFYFWVFLILLPLYSYIHVAAWCESRRLNIWKTMQKDETFD